MSLSIYCLFINLENNRLFEMRFKCTETLLNTHMLSGNACPRSLVPGTYETDTIYMAIPQGNKQRQERNNERGKGNNNKLTI